MNQVTDARKMKKKKKDETKNKIIIFIKQVKREGKLFTLFNLIDFIKIYSCVCVCVFKMYVFIGIYIRKIKINCQSKF